MSRNTKGLNNTTELVVKQIGRRFDRTRWFRFFIWTLIKSLALSTLLAICLLGIFALVNVVAGRDSWTTTLPWWLIVVGVGGAAILIGTSHKASNADLEMLWHIRRVDKEFLEDVDAQLEATLEKGK